MRSLFRKVTAFNNLSFARINTVRLASSKSDAQKEDPKNIEEIKKSKFNTYEQYYHFFICRKPAL